MTAPAFEHRHYKRLASILNDITRSEPKAVGDWLVEAFADALKGTNPNYSRDRFVAAAHGTPSNGRDRVR